MQHVELSTSTSHQWWNLTAVDRNFILFPTPTLLLFASFFEPCLALFVRSLNHATFICNVLLPGQSVLPLIFKPHVRAAFFISEVTYLTINGASIITYTMDTRPVK